MSNTPTNDSNKSVRWVYWTDLHYIPTEEKEADDHLWPSQCILFAKYNSTQFIDSDEAKRFRDLDEGVIDPAVYKKMFDPIDYEGNGGSADYVTADWKANPVYIHLNNILDTNMEKIPINLYCKAVDEYAKTNQQKENERILGRKEFMQFLNEINASIGFPKLRPNEDPFKYAQQMQQGIQLNKGIPQDAPITMLDNIKASIEDNEDMALFNEYIYKDGVEIAIELGQQHYMKENKYARIAERILPLIRNHNRCAMRLYTSQTTGRPVIEFVDGEELKTSSFNNADGSDIVHWYREWDVTFGDFVRMFGKNLSQEQLQKVFEKNKSNMAAHGLNWDTCSKAEKYAAKIRIGYCEWETQNCDVYAKGVLRGNTKFKKKPLDWVPSKNSSTKDERIERHYNVWYKCYYIPVTTLGTTTASYRFGGVEEQAEFIFDFGKVQDQQRHGDDLRGANSSLVVWKRKGMSQGEIMARYMPKINFLWFKYQNYISQNDVYKIFSNELMESMMQITDDKSKNGKAAKMAWLKMIEQTGKGLAKFTTSDGKTLDPVKVFTVGYMEAALKCLTQMQALYEQMTTAFGMSDIREGLDPKPRTSLGGIQLSLQASNNATYPVEKGYIDVTLEIGKRLMYYMKQIVEEGPSERLQEFRDIVGKANGMALESIKDIPLRTLGLHIDNINTDEQKKELIAMAQELVKAGLMDIEVLPLIIKQDNWKYAAVLMIMKYKQKQRQIQAQKDKEHKQAMELKKMDLDIEMMKIKAKAEGVSQNINVEKQWDERIERLTQELKSASQLAVREAISQGKRDEDVNRAGIEQTLKMEQPIGV